MCMAEAKGYTCSCSAKRNYLISILKDDSVSMVTADLSCTWMISFLILWKIGLESTCDKTPYSVSPFFFYFLPHYKISGLFGFYSLNPGQLSLVPEALKFFSILVGKLALLSNGLSELTVKQLCDDPWE